MKWIIVTFGMLCCVILGCAPATGKGDDPPVEDTDPPVEDTDPPPEDTDPVDADSDTTPPTDTLPSDTSPDTEDVATDVSDPCEGVSAKGRCTAAGEVEYCSAPTGSAKPELVRTKCAPYEGCSVLGGSASCNLLAGRCYPGSTDCSGKTLLTCSDSGKWSSLDCPGECVSIRLGAFCEYSGGMALYTGKITYSFKPAGEKDWGPVTTAPASGLFLVSYDELGSVVSSTTTGSNGEFSMNIAVAGVGKTKIKAFPVSRRADGRIAYAVGFPNLTKEGMHSTDDTSTASTAYYGSGSWDPMARSSGSTINFGEAGFGRPLRVFDYLRYVFQSSESLARREGKSLVVWMQPNISWDCGACFNTVRATIGSTVFDSQIWIPMVAEDESYWSDSVTAHEVGHWVMASFGTEPGEGGKHILSCATFPGQAWSEGWATLVSSLARNSSIYSDKQRGSYFWFDVAKRTSSGTVWPLPSPSEGLLGQISENDVAGMGWALSRPALVDRTRWDTPNLRFMQALQSARMNTLPFGRGYTRHRWDVAGCDKIGVSVLSDSTPIFADFLDALICNGLATGAEVEAVAKPKERYPYFASEKVCK